VIQHPGETLAGVLFFGTASEVKQSVFLEIVITLKPKHSFKITRIAASA
jgi:hypothetical protein